MQIRISCLRISPYPIDSSMIKIVVRSSWPDKWPLAACIFCYLSYAQLRARVGQRKGSPEPNTINASRPFDFTGKNLTSYGGPAAGDHHAGEACLPLVVGADSDFEANPPRHGPVPVRIENRAGSLHLLSPAESIALHGPRPDTVHVLAVRERAPSACCQADADASACGNTYPPSPRYSSR